METLAYLHCASTCEEIAPVEPVIGEDDAYLFDGLISVKTLSSLALFGLLPLSVALGVMVNTNDAQAAVAVRGRYGGVTVAHRGPYGGVAVARRGPYGGVRVHHYRRGWRAWRGGCGGWGGCHRPHYGGRGYVVTSHTFVRRVVWVRPLYYGGFRCGGYGGYGGYGRGGDGFDNPFVYGD